jgi:hypothetical protein
MDSPTVIISDFCDYLQKYSRHYVADEPVLSKYIDDTLATVTKEMEPLEADAKIFLSVDKKGRKLVFVPHFYIDRMVQRYRELEEHPEVPFPLASELPADFPSTILKPVYITSDFVALLENGERINSSLNQLIFPDDTPPLIFPASISPEKMLDLSLAKIRYFLHKDESRDFIQKRLMIANPGKEMSIKNHLVQFQTRPSEALRSLRHSGDAFLFWSFLCSFVRQDYTKKSEKTPEENALLQSVYITEYLNSYYKTKNQQDIQRETALKNLELAFQKPPYFFDMESISRFADSRGVPLLGQYRNTDLEAFIKEKTDDGELDSLPYLLVFSTQLHNRYFVLKEKVVPLVLKLCAETRKTVKEKLTHEWYQLITNYRQDGAMKSQQEFEKKLESLCQTLAPILYSVLNATFIPLLALEKENSEKETPDGFRIFEHGRLLSYGELLMLNRQELLTDTRIMLPFWYTVPIISSIFAFFHLAGRQKEESKKKNIKQPTPEPSPQEQQHNRQERKAELKKAVVSIEKRLVPSGSTLEQELSAQLDLWNRTLDPDVKLNLTEDVNSLIRDYMRRILKSLKAVSFDLARVQNLANTLVDTPGLMKIKNRDALLSYTQLYIVQLIRNIN